METLPEDYFCPLCNVKATHDLVACLKTDGMPTVFIVSMATNILSEAGCPVSLLQPVADWAGTYGQTINELNEEERHRLALHRWEKWASEPAQEEK